MELSLCVFFVTSHSFHLYLFSRTKWFEQSCNCIMMKIFIGEINLSYLYKRLNESIIIQNFYISKYRKIDWIFSSRKSRSVTIKTYNSAFGLLCLGVPLGCHGKCS